MKTNQSRKSNKWLEKELGEVATFFNGKAHENDISDNGKYVVVNSKFVSTNGSVVKYTDTCLSPLKKGDVAMVMSDVPNGKAIAKCFLVKENNKYTLNQRIGGFRSEEINSSFLYYLLNRNRYFLAFDDGVNQTNLRKDDILECPLYFPQLSEQNRIVSVLETWDKSIEKLSKKIEVKKQIKKGLIQDLLSGTKRIDGFKEKWKNGILSDIFTIKKGSGLSKEKLDDSGKFDCILYGELYTTYNEVIYSIKSKTNTHEGAISKSGDILIPASTTTGAIDLAVATCLEKDGVLLGGDINILRPKEKLDSRFFAYYLTHTKKHTLARLAQGVTIVHLYASDFKDIKIEIPKIEEQKEIANIITTAEKEIVEYEKKLEILKEQKRYLLNNLITGTIRTPETLSTKLTK